MRARTLNERIIFGLKVKQLRLAQQQSFANLAETSGMSISYLNEIRKGKKFPKPDKIETLARALGTSPEHLTNGELGRNLQPVESLLRSNFLNELPLELFGIELSKVAEIIAGAPVRVSAFVSTLLELSRSHSLREENFYFGALRAYLELHNNYFQDTEDAVRAFCERHGIGPARPLAPRQLATLLEEKFGYHIREDGLDDHPDLKQLRSVFLPGKKELLLNSELSSHQRAFQYGKELAFNALKLKERARTSSLLRPRTFEEVINHSRAIYFSVALHLPLEPFIADVRALFDLPRWDGGASLNRLLDRYNVTPEMLYHRLTNVLPKFFGLNKLFFLRFLHDTKHNSFSIDKELHLERQHHPHGNALNEHYCRRWISIGLLESLQQQADASATAQRVIDVQRSRYLGTEDEYLCITLARTGYPSPRHNVSLTLGLLITPEVRKVIRWLADTDIPTRKVNTTCERCPLLDCDERAAPPQIIQKRDRLRRINHALKELEQ